ncbi:MAG: hypothetical protein GSR74_00935, partial [Desulfurococcales archaeon]|nr:hypothetical protein [Desulfurococcales archaeon]
MEETIVLGEKCPSLEEARAILEGARVEIDENASKALAEARSSYLEEVSKREVYGYCTGLGGLYHRKPASCGSDYERRVL